MIYDFIIFSGGITYGYILTKTGYADKFIDNMYKKYLEHEKKNKTLRKWFDPPTK